MPKVELSHDSLARTIYEKGSTEDKMRLKVANFIRARHHYYEENNVLLKKDDLKYIDAHVDEIELTDNEKQFINRSRWASRKRMIFMWVVAAAMIITFIILWNNARQWGYATEQANSELSEAYAELEQKSKQQRILLDSLRYKDSIQQELQSLANQKEISIKFTQAQLEQSYKEKLVLIEQLKESNQKLEKAQKALEASLVQEKERRERIEQNYKKLNSRMTGQSKSNKLSRAAHKHLTKGKVTEEDYKKAFQLARAAWDLDQDNSQAMDVLNLIKNKKLSNNSGGFLDGTAPSITYSRPKIKSMIRSIDRKKGYGTMSKRELERYLD